MVQVAQVAPVLTRLHRPWKLAAQVVSGAYAAWAAASPTLHPPPPQGVQEEVMVEGDPSLRMERARATAEETRRRLPRAAA